MPIVNCFLCNAETYKRPSSIKKADHVFCSIKCLGKYKTKIGSEIRNCTMCNKEFKAINGNIKRRMAMFCSWGCARAWWSNNKKTSIGADGYEHFGRERNHRIIIERFIGRKLKKDEVVHHINGVKNDNRIENLQLMKKKEHHKLHYPDIKEKFQAKKDYFKTCTICSKDFHTNSYKAKFCSNHCIYVSRKEYRKNWLKKNDKN